jgi:GNAT superfamily N-acetyltransferase
VSHGLLRVAITGDVPVLLPMMQEFNLLEEIEVDPERHRRALETLLAQPALGRVFVFEVHGVAVGYAVVTFNYDLEFAGNDAFLTELFVTAPERGKGLGKAMLGEIERAAAVLEVRAFYLTVRPENTMAQRLYASGGYTVPPRLLLSKMLTR